MDLARHLRDPSSGGCIPCVRLQHQRPLEGGGITRCQILRGPDADSVSVLLNDIHRDAQGFVVRRVEPETSSGRACSGSIRHNQKELT